MNRHFQDTRYYLGRAVTTAKKGLTTELEPVVRRVRQRIGREPEPEPGRSGGQTGQRRARGRVRRRGRPRTDPIRPRDGELIWKTILKSTPRIARDARVGDLVGYDTSFTRRKSAVRIRPNPFAVRTISKGAVFIRFKPSTS